MSPGANEQCAIDILRGQSATPTRMLKLAKDLHNEGRTGLGRRLLLLARNQIKRNDDPDLYLEIFQKSALYTYKDPDLPLGWRLDRALEILETVEVLSAANQQRPSTTNQETLGLAGAIFKRKWEVDGRRHHLERALFYYLKGYAQAAPAGCRDSVLQYLAKNPGCVLDATGDQGYTGINAAFVLDHLAALEDEEARQIGLPSAAAEGRRADARRIREELIRSVPALKDRKGGEWLAGQWWYYATVAEAYFGLGMFKEAIDWLLTKPDASKLEVREWEYESTARQLARLARLQPGAPTTEDELRASDAGQALRIILRGDDRKVVSAFRGKIGLALSGGGFRASLYHIGVLARLAELDVLRHVEVLSCVSGGSIIGAHYYLEIRHLLETKTDDQIDRGDYIAIVKRVERDFLQGVQRNIRMRVFGEWTTNLKLMFWPGYSRTKRVGELYEREIFSRVDDREGRADGPHWLPDWLAVLCGYRREPRWLDGAQIHPIDDAGRLDDQFRPRTHNWRRENKAPVLILNATSLNTGHNWQFTTSYMGEPPTPVNAAIDCNDRLRRFYFKDAPPDHQHIRLGYAVAASSCVPGLFEPLALDDLYPGHSVRLVDGGVCDNQGIASLVEQDCNLLLVSDGSGQMESQLVPSAGVLGVPLRSNSILMARVREAQYADVSARCEASLLRGLLFVHLKQDLLGNAVPWVNCPSHLRESDFERDARLRGNDTTEYNVAKDTQRHLAAIRTDLDSFCDAEAHALMASGYLMTRHSFGESIPGFPEAQGEEAWEFRRIETQMRYGGEKKQRLDALLCVAGNAGFKIWQLAWPLIVLKWALAAGALAAVVWAFWNAWNTTVLPQWMSQNLTWGWIGRAGLSLLGFFLLGVALKAIVGKSLASAALRAIKWRDTLYHIAVGFGMATVGWLVATAHLWIFDRWYLRYGHRKNFVR